jgi:hypothetical protein
MDFAWIFAWILHGFVRHGFAQGLQCFWMTEKSMHAWMCLFFVLVWVLVGRFSCT